MEPISSKMTTTSSLELGDEFSNCTWKKTPCSFLIKKFRTYGRYLFSYFFLKKPNFLHFNPLCTPATTFTANLSFPPHPYPCFVVFLLLRLSASLLYTTTSFFWIIRLFAGLSKRAIQSKLSEREFYIFQQPFNLCV